MGYKDLPSQKSTERVLEENLEQGKALPELLFKRYLIEWFHDMINAQSEVLYVFRSSGGFVNPLKLYKLEATIIRIFMPISAMIVKNKLFSMPNNVGGYFWLKYGSKSDFDLVMNLHKIKNPDINVLFHICNYITYCLDEINLINLFQNTTSSELDVENL